MPFDPSEHLKAQGWEGKGKAFRQGHATRPIAVVQKKTLAGVGKDRDEATPFWDHIFASTAIQIKIPSATPSATPSGLTTPATTPSTSPPPQSGPRASNPMNRRSTLSTPYARTKQELARVSLYSRFLPPKVELPPDSEDASVQPSPTTSKAGSETPAEGVAASAAQVDTAAGERPKPKRSKAEKEEKERKKTAKRAKKAAKVLKAQEKEQKRQRKAAKKAAGAGEATS